MRSLPSIGLITLLLFGCDNSKPEDSGATNDTSSAQDSDGAADNDGSEDNDSDADTDGDDTQPEGEDGAQAQGAQADGVRESGGRGGDLLSFALLLCRLACT